MFGSVFQPLAGSINSLVEGLKQALVMAMQSAATDPELKVVIYTGKQRETNRTDMLVFAVYPHPW